MKASPVHVKRCFQIDVSFFSLSSLELRNLKLNMRFSMNIVHSENTGSGLYLRRTKDGVGSGSSPVALQIVYTVLHLFSKSEMIVGFEMRVLVAFLLAALSCSPAGARTVSKCELRSRLMQTLANLPEKAKQSGLTEEKIAAKIVRYAERVSHFNTNEVHELGDLHSREKRDVPSRGLFSMAEDDRRLRTAQPHTREQQHARPPPSQNHTTSHPHIPWSEEGDNDVCKLYGLFQLCSHLVCSDGSTPSHNICEMDCIKLVDDDISDDVWCLLKIFTNLVENGFSAPNFKESGRVIRLILQEEHKDKTTSNYFADCS
ncbi:uncharacterized protein LOC118470196 [Amphiprion ocellaris]|uniref:uncharacterized protein LOC118470196 n=1 Tax=Amphiprion ocellaris TaxID=80972 RepID=UPI002410FDAB|nr:uncharacterized protein LOC118470196 [Amphiprion ocellaris]